MTTRQQNKSNLYLSGQATPTKTPSTEHTPSALWFALARGPGPQIRPHCWNRECTTCTMKRKLCLLGTILLFFVDTSRLPMLNGNGRGGKATGRCRMVLPKWRCAPAVPRNCRRSALLRLYPWLLLRLQQRTDIFFAVKCNVRYQWV